MSVRLRYVSHKGELIGNCPMCRGVIFRHAVFRGGCEVAFTMRCPHCQERIRVTVDREGSIVIRTLQAQSDTDKHKHVDSNAAS